MIRIKKLDSLVSLFYQAESIPDDANLISQKKRPLPVINVPTESDDVILTISTP